MDDGLLTGDPAPIDLLDEAVQAHVLGERILTMRVWSPDRVIPYSDDLTNVGQTFPLGPEELEVIATGESHADLSDLAKQDVPDGPRPARGAPTLEQLVQVLGRAVLAREAMDE